MAVDRFSPRCEATKEIHNYSSVYEVPSEITDIPLVFWTLDEIKKILLMAK